MESREVFVLCCVFLQGMEDVPRSSSICFGVRREG
jgi:hypothetical protein